MDNQTASRLVTALQDGGVSSTELVNGAIARIEAGDERLNAVVVRDFERARAAAKAADTALRAGERKPLLGLPMTVKECFNVAGLPTTWGLAVPPHMAQTDAVAVARLKAAGAIILGKTNVPPMLTDWQSANPVHGTTANPWDVARTPGGSSGGSAAALAAGYVALELGTDIAGSLRAPAHFCGIYAHKATFGLIPMRGCAPPGTPELSVVPAVDLAVAGPMARCADDLILALDILAGPDEADAVGYRLHLPAPRHKALKQYRVLIIDEHPLLPTEAGIRTALAGLSDRLRKAGCTVAHESALLPDLTALGVAYSELLMAFIGADMPIETYRQACADAAALPADERAAATASVRGLALSHRDWIATDRQRARIAHQWRRCFEQWDVVVCPAMPTVAFPHDQREMDERHILVDGEPVPYGSQALWASVATLTGQPATAMPIGLSPEGLPIGVQVIGPRLEDRTTLAFVRLCERAFGGFEPPPGW